MLRLIPVPALAAGFVTCALAGVAAAEPKPLWELGLGAAVLDGPDFRGAQQRSTFVVPFPYVIYRGNFLKAEGDSVRGLLHKSDRYEINISVGGATPVRGHTSDAREDMPNLDPALEIGPSINYSLRGDDHSAWELQIRLPLRAVISADFPAIDYRGIVFNPNINLDVRNTVFGGSWRMGLSAGPLFADSRNNAYYYDVAPEYATTQRDAYRADAGYAGTRVSFALSNRIRDIWFGGFLRYDNLTGATFDNSPLVGRDNGFSVGAAFAVIFKKSSRTVEE